MFRRANLIMYILYIKYVSASSWHSGSFDKTTKQTTKACDGPHAAAWALGTCVTGIYCMWHHICAFSSHGLKAPRRVWWSAVDERDVFPWISTHVLLAVIQWPCVCGVPMWQFIFCHSMQSLSQQGPDLAGAEWDVASLLSSERKNVQTTAVADTLWLVRLWLLLSLCQTPIRHPCALH